MAQRELGKRLAAVDEGFRKPDRVAFRDFAQRFANDYLPGRNLKRSTTENYRYILDRHLLPFFGDRDLAELEAQPELIDAYIALKAQSELSTKTIQNHLLLLNVMLRRAVVWRLMRSNPVSSIDRPSLVQPEMNVLTETEIARLANAYDELIAEASEPERHVVGAREGDRAHGARDGDAARRAGRASLARRQPARGEDRGPRNVRARTSSRPRRAERQGASSSSARARSPSSRSSGSAPPTAATTTSSSAIRRRERRSRRVSSPSATSSRRSRAPGSRSRSGRFTTYVTRRSRTPLPLATRRSTCRRAQATRRARSPSDTCTLRRCCSPAPPRRARRGCSACSGTRMRKPPTSSGRVGPLRDER